MSGIADAKGVTSDSKSVAPGWIFVAIKGGTHDGHGYLEQAARSGAILLVGEEPAPPGITVPYRQVSDSRLALAELSAELHGNPSHSMKMVGVTGTSGKTTTAYLCEAILKAAGEKVGVIGTVNFRFGSKVYPSTHTTPGAPELQALLAQMKKDGCTAVVMEVSSHALRQHRTATIAFDAMVFTNLSPEHLDFHSDMADYFHAKATLFREYWPVAEKIGKAPVAVIGVEEPFGQQLARELKAAGKKTITFGDFGLKVGLSGIEGTFEGVAIRSALTGGFNASNIMAAVGVGIGLGIKPGLISQGVKAMTVAPGRLERVPHAGGIHVWVDYAHKPDALEKVLRTLKDVKGEHRLITVFGCGGDRDRTKRPVMGKIAVTLSDKVFITSDNPRTEDPQSIIREIVAGAEGGCPFEVDSDRKSAIFAAVREAKRGDLVLIAGKGHEDYQILGTQKVHFDDREVAVDALSKYHP